MTAEPRTYRHLEFLTLAFVVILLVSNLIAAKITPIGPFRVSAAQLLFPITYIFGDVFTEVYGYSASRRAIWRGFFRIHLDGSHGVVCHLASACPGVEEIRPRLKPFSA